MSSNPEHILSDFDFAKMTSLNPEPDIDTFPLTTDHYKSYLAMKHEDMYPPDDFFALQPPPTHFGKVVKALAPLVSFSGRRLAGALIGAPLETALILQSLRRERRDERMITYKQSLSMNQAYENEEEPDVWTGRYNHVGYLTEEQPEGLMDIMKQLIRRHGLFKGLFRAFHWRWLSNVTYEMSRALFTYMLASRNFHYLEGLASYETCAEILARFLTSPLERAVTLATISSGTWSFKPPSLIAILQAITVPLLSSQSSNLISRLSLKPSLLIGIEYLAAGIPLLVTIPLYNLRLRMEASEASSSPFLDLPRYDGLLDCLTQTLFEEGPAALYAGWRVHLTGAMGRLLSIQLRRLVLEMQGRSALGMDDEDDFEVDLMTQEVQ